MRKKRLEQVEHENTERWLVSYADFITLMFAFFVVMYAISSVNIGKYQIISNTLDSVFHVEATSKKPIQVGDFARSPTVFTGYEAQQGELLNPMQAISDSVELNLDVDDRNVKLRKSKNGIEIELQDNILFNSGEAELRSTANSILRDIARILEPFPNAIAIEGFTDNQPIDNIFYPSNWDLSVARSAAVVRRLTAAGVDPTRLSAIGYGEFQPIATNNNAFGRRQNRRVIIRVLPSEEIRPSLEDEAAEEAEDIVIPAEQFVGPLLPTGWQPPPVVEAVETEIAAPVADPGQQARELQAPTEVLPPQEQTQAEGNANVQQQEQQQQPQSQLRAIPTPGGGVRFVFEDEPTP